VIDLQLPEDNSLWENILGISRAIHEQRPSLVISHDECAAIPIAKTLGVPGVFLTDWFVDSLYWNMQALQYAEEILFLDEPGYYDEPAYLKGKIRYCGSVFRNLAIDEADRLLWRSRRNIPVDSTMILVVPGGAESQSEIRAPLYDLVLDAFDVLPSINKRLVWVVGKPDYDILSARSRERLDITILEPDYDDITSTLATADVVITKENCISLAECGALGVPSISISFAGNTIYDYRAIRIPTNIPLRVNGIDRTVLCHYIVTALAMPRDRKCSMSTDTSRGRLVVAETLRGYIRRATVPLAT